MDKSQPEVSKPSSQHASLASEAYAFITVLGKTYRYLPSFRGQHAHVDRGGGEYTLGTDAEIAILVAYLKGVDENKPQQGKNADAIQAGGSHYKTMQVQPWTAMEAWLTREEFIGFLKGNIIKYMARANTDKEPHDVMIQKAAHYQQKLTEVLERKPSEVSK